MSNTLYVKSFSTSDQHINSKIIKVPLESLLIISVHKFCASKKVNLIFIHVEKSENEHEVEIKTEENLTFLNFEDVPWQAKSCVLPVIIFDDLIITGICGVARHISVYRSSPNYPQEHEEGLLGFRKSCLQAPNETSIWTKFCEIDMIKTFKEIINNKTLNMVPINLVRFENHLNKPVKVHNVYKMARNLKKENMSHIGKVDENVGSNEDKSKETRIGKNRNWKSNSRKLLQIDSSVRIEDLDIHHQFAEGPYLTLADIILYPNFYLIVKVFGANLFKSILPQSYKWFTNLTELLKQETDFMDILNSIEIYNYELKNVFLPEIDDVSLYKSDPKRHNPKKRLFTKEEDILAALESLNEEMEITMSENEYCCENIDWDVVPDGANPVAGHLPDDRKDRKTQQLENMAVAVLSIAKAGELIVDFCSGSGHLGILIAYLLPECNIILLENKEQSLLRARKRVHEMNLSNVFFFQCNLDFFIGKFNIGVALHACGVASDLVLDKCLKSNAKFVLCPCCYGSLHETDRFVYPRSCKFSSIPIDKYLCIGHAADQTHEDHPLAVRGARCMAVIDSDRGRLAEEFGYKVTLSRLKPLSCTPKNNLLVGVPT